MRRKPKEIILEYKRVRRVSVVALSMGVARSTVYRWIRRAQTGYGNISSSKLMRASTRPKHIKRYEFSKEERNAILALRISKGYVATKLVAKLKLNVSARTVHRLLKRERLLRLYNRTRRPRFQNTVHMHVKNTTTIGYLQMDVKYITPELSGLTWTCFEYGFIDIYSRYKEAVILNHLDQDGSMAALLSVIPKFPFKIVFIQTDNGLEFQGRFHQLCIDLGLKHHHIHKSTPNENALIERSFRTDEEEFFFHLDKAPKHYDELRDWFAAWLHEYNYERPHLGINLQTPYQVVANVLSP